MTLGPPFEAYALEVHAVGHCNLRCLGCAQSSPAVPSRFEEPVVLERALAALRGRFRCKKVYVLGGEPLLHPQIEAILATVASAGLSGELCVKTNGLLLPRAGARFWRLVDRVLVSVYPATRRALDRHRTAMEEVARAEGAELVYAGADRFRHIAGGSGRTSDRLVRHIFEGCEYKTFTHSVSGGRLFRCAPSVNLAAASFAVDGTDSLDLLAASGLDRRIAEFLRSPAPLSACRYCLGSSGASFAHAMAAKTLPLHDRHA